MQTLISFIVLILSITTFAYTQEASPFKRTNATLISDALSSLSSIESLMNAPPPTSLSRELTAIPTSLYDIATSPLAIASIAAEFASSPPEWFEELDANAQSYVLSKSELVNSLLPIMESLQAVAGISTAGAGTATGGSTVTNKSKMTITATSEVTSATAEGATATSASQIVSATKKAGASRGGSGMAAVLLSAVGVLGAAIVL